jgi:hypothetical protein
MKSIVSILSLATISLSALATEYNVPTTNYYRAIEDKCRLGKEKGDVRMYWGKAGSAKTYSMHPLLALATGESSSNYGGGFGVQINDPEGLPFKYYRINLQEVVQLNNTDPTELIVWMEIDLKRKVVVLIDNDSCKSVGEVPYL